MKFAAAALRAIRAVCVMGVALATPLNAQDNAPDRWLSAEQVQSDIALAEEAYSRIHPGYTRYASEQEMQAVWANIAERAAADGGMRIGDLYLAVQLALTQIRCDHTKAELPASLRDARLGQPLYLPFRWKMVEGRGLIEFADPRAGLSRGDEIVEIDGRPLAQMASEVAPYIPVDGYTEWARNGGISQSLEFMGGALDHFGMLLWPVASTADIVVRNSGGQERRVAAPRISFSEWSALGADSGAASNFADAVHFEWLGASTAYLKIDTFVNYREPVEPHTLLEPVFEALAQKGPSTLILDLRENGGGSTDASQALASYLLQASQPLKLSMQVATLDLSGVREHLTTWDARALNPDPRGFIANADGTYIVRDGVLEDTAVIEPADAAFAGRLIILTSNNNSSGSTNLLAVLAEQDRTTLVGERTGGSAEGPTAGLLFTLTLPESGIRTRIPLFRYRNNVQDFDPGLGVTPDIAAPMTVAAFRAAEDPAIEAALVIAQSPLPNEQADDASPNANIEDFAALEGDDWSGELEYLNYNSDERSAIPTRLTVQAPRGSSIRYGVIYPGEEDANARDRLRVSRDGTQINGFAIVRRFQDAERGLVLVTEGSGRDNNRSADIRLTYEIAADRFVMRKDVRFDGGDWIHRNSYRLGR